MRISDWSSDVCSSDLALRAAAAGQQAQRDLRQAHLRALQRHAVVAAERVFQAAAEGEAVDRSDDRLVALLQHVLRLARRTRPALAELADVGAGDEGTAGAGQDHRLDVRVRSDENTSELQSLN